MATKVSIFRVARIRGFQVKRTLCRSNVVCRKQCDGYHYSLRGHNMAINNLNLDAISKIIAQFPIIKE